MAHSRLSGLHLTALVDAAGVASLLTITEAAEASIVEGEEEKAAVGHQEWVAWAWVASKPCSLGYTRTAAYSLLLFTPLRCESESYLRVSGTLMQVLSSSPH